MCKNKFGSIGPHAGASDPKHAQEQQGWARKKDKQATGCHTTKEHATGCRGARSYHQQDKQHPEMPWLWKTGEQATLRGVKSVSLGSCPSSVGFPSCFSIIFLFNQNTSLQPSLKTNLSQCSLVPLFADSKSPCQHTRDQPSAEGLLTCKTFLHLWDTAVQSGTEGSCFWKNTS